MPPIQKVSKAIHKWSDKNRVILLILKSLYTRKDTTSIWNFIFRTRLATEGFPNGIPATRLDGQYQEVKNGGKGFNFFTQVDGATVDELRTTFPEYWAEIQVAARNLKLAMANKHLKPSSLALARRRRGRMQAVTVRHRRVDDPNELRNVSTSSYPSLQHFTYQSSPYFTQVHEVEETTSQTPSLSTFQPASISIPVLGAAVKSFKHPQLLFRATPEIAAFRSRLYHDPAVAIPVPPVFGTKGFRDLVWPHLERDRTYERSPFISLAQNPHNALRRVELARSENIDTKMFLVIFGYEDPVQDGINQFGVPTGPYLVRSLFTAEEISDLPDGYKGAGEFLCYGAIKCEPIAILDSYRAINLARALRRFKAGRNDALLQIHENMQPVPLEWKETIAQQLLNRYCGKSRVPAVNSSAYNRLMHVIFDGGEDDLRAYEQEPANFSTGRQEDSDPDYEESEADVAAAEVEPEWVLLNTNNTREQSRKAVDGTAIEPSDRVMTDGLDSSWITVEKLNNIASDRSVASTSGRVQVRRKTPTPFWSPSPATEPEPQHSSAEDQAPMQQNNDTEKFNDGWDSLDDLDLNFAEGLDSAAARKVTGPLAITSHCDFPLPSIEWNSATDEFPADLTENVYKGTPTPLTSLDNE